MSKERLADHKSNVNPNGRHSILPILLHTPSNPLPSIESVKRQFRSVQLPALGAEIYAMLTESGYSPAYARAEVDRAYRELRAAIDVASRAAIDEAAKADAAKQRKRVKVLGAAAELRPFE